MRNLKLYSFLNNKSRMFLGLLVLLAVAVRLAIVYEVPRCVQWDEPEYLLLGRNLLTGHGYTIWLHPNLHFPPLFPIVSGTIDLLVHNLEVSSDLVYAVFGALVLIPVFMVARRIYGLRTAWVAAILVGLSPTLAIVVFTWGTMTEPLYLFLVFSTLAAMLAGIEDGRPRMFALSGFCFGLACLTRVEGVVYFGLFAAIAAFHWLCRQQRSHSCVTVPMLTRPPWLSTESRGALYFVGLFAVTACPYVLYIHHTSGHWTLAAKVSMYPNSRRRLSRTTQLLRTKSLAASIKVEG